MSSYNKKRFNSPIVAVNKAEVNVIGRFKEVQELGLFDTRIRDVLTDGVNFNLNELISELDSKGFTQSTFTPEQVRSQILKFAEPNKSSFQWNTHYQSALQELKREFSGYGLKMINPDKTNIYDLFEKIDTHPGIIRFEDEEIHLKKDWLEQVTQSEIENVIEGHLDGTKYVIIPSTRTQNTPKGNLGYVVVKDCKTRLISMIDIRQILMESMFAKPFNELFVKKSMYAGGKNDQQLSRWINDQRLVSNYWYCIDYSSFDQTISNWLIYDAFDIVKSSFTLSPREEQIFDQIVKNFIYKEFIQVDGSHVHSSKGIPSGSRFTQIIGSLCNYLMIKTYFNRMQDCGLKSSVTMGDDNLFFTGREVDIDHLSTYLAHNFGVETNASKFDCGVSHKDAPTFLSRTWNHEGPGRSEVEILSKLMYPEKFRNYVGNVQLDPYLIIFASYLTYPYTWKRSLIKEGSELFYKLRELESKLSLKKLTKEQLVAISGALRYQLEYLDNSWL